MDREKLVTLAPLFIVFVIAIGITAAGILSSPRVLLSLPSSSSAPNATASPNVIASATSAGAPTTTPSANSRSNDPAEMLRVQNELRAAIGAPMVRTDDRVALAAQRHAEYLVLNGAVGHEEAAGAPGFSGATVTDRLAAQGYGGATASEVAATFGSGTDDVLFLWDLPYHRLGLMHPHAVISGWAHAEDRGRTATVGVLVYDFGVAAPEVVRSPAAGQRVPASWSGEESPEVLPSGAARPVGYPVMAVYGNATPVDLRVARLTDASGREIAIYAVPRIYERDYVAIIPAAPLAAGARYRVRLELTAAGTERVDEWEFETER
jgi:uncharacterized protein YkwD